MCVLGAVSLPNLLKVYLTAMNSPLCSGSSATAASEIQNVLSGVGTARY